jgi:hypothetical protein
MEKVLIYQKQKIGFCIPPQKCLLSTKICVIRAFCLALVIPLPLPNLLIFNKLQRLLNIVYYIVLSIKGRVYIDKDGFIAGDDFIVTGGGAVFFLKGLYCGHKARYQIHGARCQKHGA